MSTNAPVRKSNAELAEAALAKARRYRARAREEERRLALELGLWVQGLAAKGDAEAFALYARWSELKGRKAPAATQAEEPGEAATDAPGEEPLKAPGSRQGRDPSQLMRTARGWQTAGLELVSGQVHELVLQGRRIEARELIVKAEKSIGITLVPPSHRAKWGLGWRPGEIIGSAG